MKFIILSFFLSSLALAEHDLSVGISGRMTPLGGTVNATAGYGLKIWEKEATGEELNIYYGYIRPHIEINTAALYNRAVLGLDVYPISFFGTSFGASIRHNGLNHSSDAQFLDVEDTGLLTSYFASATLKLAYKNNLFLSTVKREDFRQKNNSRGYFYEENYVLHGNKDQDTLYDFKIFVGYDKKDVGMMGFLFEGARMEKTQSSTSNQLVIWKLPVEGSTSYVVGCGRHHSDFYENKFQIIFSINHGFAKGVVL